MNCNAGFTQTSSFGSLDFVVHSQHIVAANPGLAKGDCRAGQGQARVPTWPATAIPQATHRPDQSGDRAIYFACQWRP